MCLFFGLWSGAVSAQEISPEDEVINTIRPRTDIGESDQRRIADWVEDSVNKFTGFTPFMTRFKTQYENPSNSPQFRTQLAVQTAQAEVKQFAKPDLNGELAHALAYVLALMDKSETVTALVAGLQSSDGRARYMCAKGLAAQKTSIAGDKGKLDQVVTSLRQAGLAESSPAVRGRIYEALTYAGQGESVFNAYMAIFDKRLTERRGEAVIANGAEIYAHEFFRTGAVLGALDAAQKSQLVSRLAVFLRIDAQRYSQPNLQFDEIDKIERTLDAVEEILTALVGANGGKIRDVLQAGAYDDRASVLKEAYRWVGNPETKETGPVNEAPWNVPAGAP
jgi:hypothetical protein